MTIPRTQLSQIDWPRPYRAVLIYDTNYLLGPRTYKTFVELVANLQEYRHVIPEAVHRELEKFKRFPSSHTLHKQARKVLAQIQSQMQEGLLILQTPEDYIDTEMAKQEKDMDTLILGCAHYIWNKHTCNIWLMTKDNGLRNRARSFNICVQTSEMTDPDSAKGVIKNVLMVRSISEVQRKRREERGREEAKLAVQAKRTEQNRKAVEEESEVEAEEEVLNLIAGGDNGGGSYLKMGLAVVAVVGIVCLGKCAVVYGVAKMGGSKLLATTAVSSVVVAKAVEDDKK